MGIYLPNMEMPTSCGDCKAFVCYRQWAGDIGDCFCGITKNDAKAKEKNADCPLVPVPEHGRLIDAEAFSSEMKERQTAAIKWMQDSVQDHDSFIRAEATVAFLSEVKLTLDKMPTIIPADHIVDATEMVEA